MTADVKSINIKNQTYYFFRTWFKLTKNRQKSYKNIGIYYTGYITIKKWLRQCL